MTKSKYTAFMIILAILVPVLLVISGLSFIWQTGSVSWLAKEPEVVTRIVYYPKYERVEVEKIVYVDRIVYEERIVDHYPAPEIRVVERRLMPKWFESEQELRDWYEDNKIGWLTVRDATDPELQDCDDYVEELMDRAFRTGYLLFPVPVWNGKVMGERVVETYEAHVGLWTWIGNDIYYIEATPSDEPIKKLRITRDRELRAIHSLFID